MVTRRKCVYESVKAAITKYYGLRGLNNRNWFLIVMEAGKSKIRYWLGQFPVRGPF